MPQPDAIQLADPELAPYVEETLAFNERMARKMAASPMDLSSPEAIARSREAVAAQGGQPAAGATTVDVAGEHGVVPVRVLRPQRVRGVYLHLHGGGFVFGTAAACDESNARLAEACGLAVVSVDYRLAPEHPYPAAVDDAVAAARWLLDEADREFGTTHLLIGGESSGAVLAVQTLLRLRDTGTDLGRWSAANLLYGSYDFSGSPSQRHAPNLASFVERIALVYPDRDPEQLRDPAISPLYAHLAGMPPAMFTIGGNDPYLDDNLFMAMRWRTAGGHATVHVYPCSIHGFDSSPTQMAAVARARIESFLAGRVAGADATSATTG